MAKHSTTKKITNAFGYGFGKFVKESGKGLSKVGSLTWGGIGKATKHTMDGVGKFGNEYIHLPHRAARAITGKKQLSYK